MSTNVESLEKFTPGSYTRVLPNQVTDLSELLLFSGRLLLTVGVGSSMLMVERRASGVPVTCAGGTRRHGLDFEPIPRRWFFL